MDRGCYIAFEGSEGSGKSTHARRLAVELDAVLTFEHGGTPIGKLVRAILADPANSEMTDKAEALLIAADRAQHIEQVVRPALEAGRNVVSDRSIYSSLACRGYGRGLPLDEVRAVNEWAIDGCWPDLVASSGYRPCSWPTACGGVSSTGSSAPAPSSRLRRRGFRRLAAADPKRWVVLGLGSIRTSPTVQTRCERTGR
jgi:dTMP kinase